MKNLKSILLGLTLLVVAVAAKATGNQPAGKLTKNDVLNIYMNAAAHGKIEGLDKVLAEDVQYNMTRGERTISIDKKQMMESFKAGQNVEQNCKCSTTTIEDNDERLVVKFDMKFEGYTSTHVITIVNKGYGWEISKVDTSVA
ncbi:MAG: nuclear transport factor 2 family protein [Mucilaginibacter sp.]